MKRLAALCVIMLSASMVLDAYPVYFKEQYFRLYHTHYIQYPDDTIENIYWLEQARKAEFCNPLYALAKIDDKRQWERYRYLLDMHIDLKLIEQHLLLGSKFDKRVAYFFNAPWKRENLEGLKTAETAYRTALVYWKTAKDLALKAESIKWIHLPEVQFWEDESYRIASGELDYERIISREIERLQSVRARFEAMDEATY